MKKIIGSRDCGKTRKLLEYAKEKGYKISSYRPEALRKKAYSYGITGVEIIGYSDAVNISYDENDNGILIDNLNLFAEFVVSKNKLKGYTLTIDD